MSTDLELKGPIAEGRGVKVVDRMCSTVEDEIGQDVYDAVRRRLSQVLVNPTGYYESRVQTERAGDSVTVTDGGVIYGPWLEGTSSRNGRSRFKGYATFRRVTQDIEGKAGDDADRVVARDLGRLE